MKRLHIFRKFTKSRNHNKKAQSLARFLLRKLYLMIRHRRPPITFLYVMYCYDFPYKFKCGITTDVERRRLEIQAQLSAALQQQVLVRVACWIPTFVAERHEHRIHTWLAPLRVNGMVFHNGYKEWFYYANPISATIITVLFYYWGLKVSGGYWLAFMAIPLFPLDAVLLVFVVLVFEIIIIVAGLLVLFGSVYLFTKCFKQ